jgi:hypothetical protein
MDHLNHYATYTCDPLCRGEHEKIHLDLCPILHSYEQEILYKRVEEKDKALGGVHCLLLEEWDGAL